MKLFYYSFWQNECFFQCSEDKSLMSLTGKVLMTCDLARRYGFKDVDGRVKICILSLYFILLSSKYNDHIFLSLSRSQRCWLHFPDILPVSESISLLDGPFCSVIHTCPAIHAHLGQRSVLNCRNGRSEMLSSNFHLCSCLEKKSTPGGFIDDA